MLAFMGSWPAWMVYAVVGGICGAIGGALGSLAGKRQKLRTILVVVGFVSSRYVTELLVLPQVENDVANAGLPKAIDDVTTLERVEMSGKAVRYFFRLDDKVPFMEGAAMKSVLGPNSCPFWKQKFQSGQFTMAVYDYTFKDGKSSFTIDPSDCP